MGVSDKSSSQDSTLIFEATKWFIPPSWCILLRAVSFLVGCADLQLLDTMQPMERKRQGYIHELIQTEERYMDDLQLVIEVSSKLQQTTLTGKSTSKQALNCHPWTPAIMFQLLYNLVHPCHWFLWIYLVLLPSVLSKKKSTWMTMRWPYRWWVPHQNV